MLGTLPPIAPREAYTLWSPVQLPPTTPPETSTNASQQHQHRRNAAAARNPALVALELEEEALAARKANVRRFGATWLRPPGVPKTYQAMVDEATERAEQEAIARREAAMAEQQQAAEEEARRMQALHGMDVDGEDEMEGMERDLDGEVPEAEAMGGSEEDDGFETEEEGERDLDDDVPEAGSYEHTDTEVEEPSSDEEAVSPAQMAQEHVTPENRSGERGNRGPTVVQNFRMPIPPAAPGSGVSSHGEADSSLLDSSPTAARRPQRRPPQSAAAAVREHYGGRARQDAREVDRQGENRPTGR